MTHRKFAKRMVLFLVLVLLVNFMLDRAFKEFSVHNIVNRRMDEQFAEYDDTLTYLTMGNSHNCISTYILENSFNYGSPSENYIQTYYKLRYILEETGKKPEILLLQTDISSFGPKIAQRYEYNSYWSRYINYLELARVKKSRDILTKWLEGKFFSYAGNYKDIQLSILYRIKIKTLEMYHGYRPHRDFRNFAHEPDPRRAAFNKANLILSEEAYLDPTIRVYFGKIMDLCQKHDVKVILVRFPMTRVFDEEETKIVPEDRLYEEVEAIALQYPVFDRIMDYHTLFFDHPEYFFDPDHLNIKGSELFTFQLAADLRKMRSGTSEQAPEGPGNP